MEGRVEMGGCLGLVEKPLGREEESEASGRGNKTLKASYADRERARDIAASLTRAS